MHVQCDLVFRDREGVLSLVEVKSATRSGLARVSLAQQRRLERVCLFLSYWERVTLYVAFVEGPTVRLIPL